MTNLSCSQGFCLCGTNSEEILSIRVLVVAPVQALVDLVQALVLVQAHVDLVLALVALVQAHPPQGGLLCVVKRQIVVGHGSGFIWICLMDVWERVEEETGLLLTGCVGVGDRVG